MEKSIEEQINRIIGKNSTIAIHTISGENAVEDVASILWKGLEQSGRTAGGLPGNFNIINNIADIVPNIYARDANGNKIVVVVSIPEVLKDKNNEEWYMGIYPTKCRKYDERVDSLPVNRMLESEKLVPREFIAGLYIYNDGTTTELNGTKLITGHVEKFVPNSNFIGVMTEEEQKDYFESIKDKLIEKGLRRITDDVSKNSALNALLGISSYYEDELKQYQQRAGKHK